MFSLLSSMNLSVFTNRTLVLLNRLQITSSGIKAKLSSLIKVKSKLKMRKAMASLQKEKSPETSKKVSKVDKKKLKEPKVKIKKQKKVKQVLKRDKKLKKPKAPANVLIINPKMRQKDSALIRSLSVLIATFYEYAGITKVNGMFYLRKFVTRGWLRFLWSCIMIGLLSFAATLIYLLYRRYLDSPTRVTIASPKSINTIPFPAVTICHPQNVMEYKSKEFVKRV